MGIVIARILAQPDSVSTMTIRRIAPTAYIEEVMLPPVISGVDTGVTAFVGRAARGPVDSPTPVTSFVDFERLFGGFWLKSDLGNSVQDFFEQGGRRAVVVRAHLPAPHDVATLTWGRGSSRLVLEATSPGAWGSDLEATIDPLPRNRFDLTVTDRGSGLVETFTGLSLAARSARRVDRMLEESALIRVRLPLPTTLPPRLPVTVTANGGNDGGRFGTSAYTGFGMQESGRGIYALDRAALVNLIVLPPYSITTGVPRRVLTAAIAYAGERRAMMILDPPSTWHTVNDAAVGAAGFFESRDAAIYFPRLSRADPIRGGRVRDFAPSGTVAGMLARLDLNHGVWRSAAGGNGTLSGVTPSMSLTKSDLDQLNLLGINGIRALPGRGTVVWGARTRAGAGDAEWKYVNVRRLALFLEESIRRGLDWAVFEPNDESLWTRVRGQVDGFLYGVFHKGAFPATRLQDAYFVRCGPDTMTQDDIDYGRLIVLVGLAPVRPAEFVILRIGQWREDDD
jgi:phage tail sheath protein FI